MTVPTVRGHISSNPGQFAEFTLPPRVFTSAAFIMTVLAVNNPEITARLDRTRDTMTGDTRK